jgi:hypothetical protein
MTTIQDKIAIKIISGNIGELNLNNKFNNITHITYMDNEYELINFLTELANSGKFVFRGYNTQDQLYPLIIRENRFSSYEFEFLEQFEKYASHYFSAYTIIDFLSYGQHYGCLLDYLILLSIRL